MLKIKEDSGSEHVRAMAKYFNSKLDKGNDASTIAINNDQANGFISSYRLFNGLRVWVYNVTFLKDFEVDMGLSEDRPYYFCYNVKGHFLHRFGIEDDFVEVLQNQNMIVRGSPDTSVHITFPANVKLEIAVIVVDINLLGSIKTRNAKRIHLKLEAIFEKSSQDGPYRHLGKIDSQTEKYASIVCENNDVDLVGGLLTEGAVLNMLASQIRSYSTDGFVLDPKILSRYELSKITSLGAHVLSNLETVLTIDELSDFFKLSPKKLQIGVKYLYGDTVGRYISNIRMGHARHLFITTDYNVSEVCHLIGLSSKSYFSKKFKNRYGVSPSLYRETLYEETS